MQRLKGPKSEREKTMKRMKDRFERFKQWQQKPFDYEFESNEEQHCNNCGHTFTGNYCPYCSQKAGEGDIGWRSVRQSVMDVWGLGSRSMPNTIKQLLLRPGYLISDYISGKRQVSFPPVKMLFIVSVVAVFLIYYLLPMFLGKDYDVYGGNADKLNGFAAWIKGHFVWYCFIQALLYVVPTWVMFRYAPRHTRHTLPQGFFIQIFLLGLNLIISSIALLPLHLIGYSVYLAVSLIVLIVYYFIAYKQLFGYSTWGTLWRLVVVSCFALMMMTALALVFFEVDTSAQGVEVNKYILVGIAAFIALIILAVGWCLNLIATRVTRKKGVVVGQEDNN